jgi:predicted permease
MALTTMLGEVRQDARLAVRLFRRAPFFFTGAVVTLAIGIGANGAVFSILRAALLQPLPYERPEELVMAWRAFPNRTPPVGSRRPLPERGALTSPMVLAWRRELSRELGDIAGMLSWDGNLEAQFDITLGDRAERLNGSFVTPNFFELLGVGAARGRMFGTEDGARGEPLAVLSHALWQRAFGGDPGVVGRSVTFVAGQPRGPRTFIVAGILPRGMHFTYPAETEVWAMMPWADVERYEPRAIGWRAVVRLRQGVGLDQAQLRARELQTGFERPEQPPEDRPFLRLESIHEWVVGEVRPSLQLLGGVAALLLLITCVTVANGLLARTSERQQELSVRAALGARRSRLVRQLLTEGAMLSIAGALGGSGVAIALQPVLRALLPASVPRVGELTVSGWMLGFGVVTAALTTLVAVVAPALGGTRVEGAAELARSSAGASATRRAVRLRQALLGVQAAIATTLLISAALLMASLWRLARVPLGFEGDEVVTVEMRLLDRTYRQPGAVARFQDELLERVRAIPGITEAGLTSAVPFRGVDFTLVLGRPGVPGEHIAKGRFVDSGYFDVLRIPLLRGRRLSAADDEGAAPVVVISESYAREVFGADDPIGKQIVYDGPREIVGVVGDVRYTGLDIAPDRAVYLPRAQTASGLICIVARTTVGLSRIAPAIHRAIHEIDPDLPAMKTTTIDRIIESSVATRRFYTVATASFATIALLLTVVGLMVVVARVVTERRRELAIRAALGATSGRLTRHATVDAIVAVCIGTLAGIGGAYAASVVLAQFLFQVTPRSPALYSAVVAVVLAVTVIAAWLPVRRFERVPLSRILRAE